MGFLDTVAGVFTAGQCTTGGCGGDHKAFALGDSIANTFTFGQCNGNGCGGDHTDPWTPTASIFGGGSSDDGDTTTIAGSLGLSQDGLNVIGLYAALGLGALIIFELLWSLLWKII